MHRQATSQVAAPLTLWVERGFSRREIAPRMRQAVPSLTLVTSPPLTLPDTELVPLPSFDTGDLPCALDEANRLIAKHGIGALWVQDSALYDLSGLDCTVHRAATPEVISLVDDKARFSDWLGNDPLRADAVEVTGAEAIATEYYRRRAEGRDTCIKPAISVFGNGYWHLTETPGEVPLLQNPRAREMHPAVYFEAYRRQEGDQPTRMLMMDYLPGPEVSIDVLCWYGEPQIHAARTKLEGDRQVIQSEHPLVDHAYGIVRRLGMHGIVGLQYRLDPQGSWRMLEINPRPAGGVLHSEDAGFGLIAAWAQLVAGVAGPADLRQYQGETTLAFTYQRVYEVVSA